MDLSSAGLSPFGLAAKAPQRRLDIHPVKAGRDVRLKHEKVAEVRAAAAEASEFDLSGPDREDFEQCQRQLNYAFGLATRVDLGNLEPNAVRALDHLHSKGLAVCG